VYLDERPEDKGAALALVDLLMEEQGLSKLQACRQVARRVVKRRNEHAVDAARSLIGPRSPMSNWLMHVIRRYPSEARTLDGTVVIAVGWRPPTLLEAGARPSHYWGQAVVLVGARWILRAARLFQLFDSGEIALQELRRHTRPAG